MSDVVENYKAIVETSLDGVYQVDRSGAFMYINESFASLFGYKKEELMGRPFARLLSKEDLPRIEQMVEEVFSGKNVRDEALVKHKDGYEVPVLFSATPLRANDDIIGLTGILRDITERKKLEEALRLKEEYFRELIGNSMDAILVLDGEGTIRYESPSFGRLWGYDPQQRVGKTSFEFVHSGDLLRLKKALAKLLEHPGSTTVRVARVRHRDGSWHQIEAIAKNLLDHPPVEGIVLNIRDITELKRSEEAQREAEEWCSALIKNSRDAVVVVQDGIIKFANNSEAELLGYPMEELIGRHYLDTVPSEYKESMALRYERRMDGSIPATNIEAKVKRKDGQTRDVEASGSIITYHGKPAYMGIVRDITRRKQDEEALRQSEGRYRMLADNMKDIVWKVDLNLNLTYVSPSIQQVSGYSVEEVMSMGLWGLAESPTPASLDRIEPITSRVLAAKEMGQGDLPEALTLELDLMRKDGAMVPVEMNINLLRDLAGRPIGFLGNTRDISERKKAEEALVQSEEWHRALVETAGGGGQAIVVLQNTPDREAAIVFANHTVSEQLGYSLVEMGSMSAWDMFEPSELRAIQERYKLRQRGEGIPSYYETALLRKDGTTIPIEASVSTMTYQGKVATVVYARDITGRRRAEEQLASYQERLRRLSAHLSNVKEDEMKRIAGIIHDELGQSLAALKMDLSWLHSKIDKNQQLVLNKTEAMAKSVDEIIHRVRSISAELRPAMLDELGLVPALEWQANQFVDRTGIKCQMSFHGEDAVIGSGCAITLFRVLQEALTNVALHSNATRVKVSLREQKGKTVLKIIDNGRGITQEQINGPESFGLMGIRERANSLGGEFKISGVPGKGTTLMFSIPTYQKDVSH